jgi:hypothetical protein
LAPPPQPVQQAGRNVVPYSIEDAARFVHDMPRPSAAFQDMAEAAGDNPVVAECFRIGRQMCLAYETVMVKQIQFMQQLEAMKNDADGHKRKKGGRGKK